MVIRESILARNPCYTAGRKITVKGLMLHSVGCAQPSACVFINLWNNENYGSACVHGFIDAKDGVVYQTLPWDHRGWHAGGSANNTHIGVEMCEPSTIKYTNGATLVVLDKEATLAAVKRTYDSAVQLFARLCKQFKLDPLADGVIVSHKEGHARGIASNHGDPEHLWNQTGAGYTMNGFRKDVKAAMDEIYSAPSDLPYKVRINISNLNIRTKPTVNSASKGFVTPGIYTISEESTGEGASKWGKLKSGAGWISLDYCEKYVAGVKPPSEVDLAIDKLTKLGIIEKPDYWKKTIKSVTDLSELLIKVAARFNVG